MQIRAIRSMSSHSKYHSNTAPTHFHIHPLHRLLAFIVKYQMHVPHPRLRPHPPLLLPPPSSPHRHRHPIRILTLRAHRHQKYTHPTRTASIRTFLPCAVPRIHPPLRNVPPPAHHHDAHDEEAREQERGNQRCGPVRAEQPAGVAPICVDCCGCWGCEVGWSGEGGEERRGGGGWCL